MKTRVGSCKDGTPLYMCDDGMVWFGCFTNIAQVAEPEAPAAPTTEPPKPEEKESEEDIAKRARKPPADGPCKGCGLDKPLNRLMLCYKCWVYKRLNDADPNWLPGDPHPAHCGCDAPGGCSTKDQGN